MVVANVARRTTRVAAEFRPSKRPPPSPNPFLEESAGFPAGAILQEKLASNYARAIGSIPRPRPACSSY